MSVCHHNYVYLCAIFQKVSPSPGFSFECVCIVNCSASPDTKLIKMHCSYRCSGCGQYTQCAKYNIEIYIECNKYNLLQH